MVSSPLDYSCIQKLLAGNLLEVSFGGDDVGGKLLGSEFVGRRFLAKKSLEGILLEELVAL